MPYIPSKYWPIWNRLKATGTATIVADKAVHRRLIKAVQARRDRDLQYKYQLAQKGLKHKIQWTIVGNTITFTLTERVTIYALIAE